MKLVAACLVVLGCGGGSPAATDGAVVGDGSNSHGGSDSGIDGAPTTGLATVTYAGNVQGERVSGLPVVFVEQDNSSAIEMTDANGQAQHVISRDATVTLVDNVGTVALVTIMNVQPGAALQLGYTYPQHAKIAHMTTSWPSEAANYFYDVETPCGGMHAFYQETAAAFDLDDRCTGTFTATVTSYSNGHAQAYQTLAGVSAADGGAITFSGTWTPIVVADAAFTTTVGTELSGTLTAAYAQATYLASSDVASSPSTDGTAQLFYFLPPTLGADYRHDVIVDSPDQTEQVIGRRLTSTTALGFDTSAALKAPITSGNYTAATQTVTWTTAPGAAPDAVRATFHYSHGGTYPTWTVIAPGNVTSIAPPHLPGVLAMYDVVEADSTTGDLALLHVDRSYAAMLDHLAPWFARANLLTTIDWSVAPTDLTAYAASVASF